MDFSYALFHKSRRNLFPIFIVSFAFFVFTYFYVWTLWERERERERERRRRRRRRICLNWALREYFEFLSFVGFFIFWVLWSRIWWDISELFKNLSFGSFWGALELIDSGWSEQRKMVCFSASESQLYWVWYFVAFGGGGLFVLFLGITLNSFRVGCFELEFCFEA